MPHTSSAKKRYRQDLKRRLANKSVASAMKTAIKKVLRAVQEANPEEARAQLPIAMKMIDKAAKKHVIHANSASRKKSRVSRLVQNLESP